jgi:hypothetical protein
VALRRRSSGNDVANALPKTNWRITRMMATASLSVHIRHIISQLGKHLQQVSFNHGTHKTHESWHRMNPPVFFV